MTAWPVMLAEVFGESKQDSDECLVVCGPSRLCGTSATQQVHAGRKKVPVVYEPGSCFVVLSLLSLVRFSPGSFARVLGLALVSAYKRYV